MDIFFPVIGWQMWEKIYTWCPLGWRGEFARTPLVGYLPLSTRNHLKNLCTHSLQIAEALMYLHGKGVVHGNIKVRTCLSPIMDTRFYVISAQQSIGFGGHFK